MPDQIKDFMTPATILTYAGASLLVLILSNVYRILTRANSPWPCFIIALLVSVLTARIAKTLNTDPLNLVMIFINGCMLFYSAAGAQGWTVNLATPVDKGHIEPNALAKKPKVPWLSKWL